MGPRPLPRRILAVSLLLLAPALAGCLGGIPIQPPETPDATPVADDLVGAEAADPPRPPPTPRLQVERSDPDDPQRVRVTLGWDGDGTILEWSVDFGDGLRTRTGEEDPPQMLTHRYRGPGTYRVTYTLYGEAAQSLAVHERITVRPAGPPLPPLTLDSDRTHGPVPLTITFLPATAAAPGDLLRWTLDPGDGREPYGGIGAPPDYLEHRYTTVGTHIANLSVLHDDGTEQHTTHTVDTTAPIDRTVWTLHDDRSSLRATDTRDLTTTTLDLAPGCTDDCPQALDVATTRDHVHVLIADIPGRTSLLSIEKGNHSVRIERSLSTHATALATTPAGDLWITYRTHDHIHRLPGGTGALQTWATHPLGGGPKHLGASPDGHTVWVGDASRPGLLLALDTTTGETETLRMPTATAVRWIDENTKHGIAVALTAAGNAHIVLHTSAGPVHHAVMDPRLGADPRPLGLACPPTLDHCWALYDNGTFTAETTSADGRDVLVRFRATDGEVLERRPLDRDADVLGLAHDPGRVFLGMLEDDAMRLIVLDDETGETRHETTVVPPNASADPETPDDTEDDGDTNTTSTADPARTRTPFALTVHPHWPDILYVTDPVTGGWATVEATTGRTVQHVTAEAHGPARAWHVG